MESTSEIERLERRLHALERRSRWTMAGCVALGALALAGFTRGQQRVVRAERYELVSGRGEVVGEWATYGERPVLSVGRVSEPRIEVGMIAPGGSPALQISDRGKLRVSLDFQRDIGATGLYLFGPEASGGANVTLLHVPRRGPELWLREGSRTVFRVPANGI